MSTYTLKAGTACLVRRPGAGWTPHVTARDLAFSARRADPDGSTRYCRSDLEYRVPAAKEPRPSPRTPSLPGM